MAVKTFAVGELVTASDANTYLANSGLVFVKQTSITSGVSSVTVTNAFSAEFVNYRIVVHGATSTVGGHSIKFQLNNSTGTSYRIGGVYGSYGSATLTGYGPPATDSWTDILPLDVTECAGSIEIYSPFLNRRTLMASAGTRSGSVGSWYQFHGEDTSTASNTGFTMTSIAGGSTFTGGTIIVYGYRKT